MMNKRIRKKRVKASYQRCKKEFVNKKLFIVNVYQVVGETTEIQPTNDSLKLVLEKHKTHLRKVTKGNGCIYDLNALKIQSRPSITHFGWDVLTAVYGMYVGKARALRMGGIISLV